MMNLLCYINDYFVLLGKMDFMRHITDTHKCFKGRGQGLVGIYMQSPVGGAIQFLDRHSGFKRPMFAGILPQVKRCPCSAFLRAT